MEDDIASCCVWRNIYFFIIIQWCFNKKTNLTFKICRPGIGDEVLDQKMNNLIPAKVISASAKMQGDLWN